MGITAKGIKGLIAKDLPTQFLLNFLEQLKMDDNGDSEFTILYKDCWE